MTAPDTVLWVLTRTRTLLEQGWTQEGALDAKGRGVTPLSHKAVSWDLYGAIQRARQDFYDFLTEKDQVFGPGEVQDLIQRSEKVVTDRLGGRIAPWNDTPGRTSKEVLDLVTYSINVEQVRIDRVAHLALGVLTPQAISRVLSPFIPGALRKNPRDCPVARYLRAATGWSSIPFQFDTIHHRKEPDEHFKEKKAITWETYRGNRHVVVSTLTWGYFQVDGTVTFRYRFPPHISAWIRRWDNS